jgi:hypothetical protein
MKTSNPSFLLFRIKYLLLTILLFVIEVLIALYIHDKIIRPYIGDLLVAILIYCFLRTFINLSVITTAMLTLLFSYTVETLQYFKIVDLLGLHDSKIARIIIGTSFEWSDILSYTIGIAIVLLVERKINKLNVATSY